MNGETKNKEFNKIRNKKIKKTYLIEQQIQIMKKVQKNKREKKNYNKINKKIRKINKKNRKKRINKN